MANLPADWQSILEQFSPEKRARFKAYASVISELNTPVQSLFVLDNDNEFDTFKRDFDEFLSVSGYLEDRALPYHTVRMGYDGDMLDDMFRLVISSEAKNFEPTKISADELYSKQAIFSHLYKTISKEKFLLFHITEFPLAYYFENAVTVDVEDLADVLDPGLHDETVLRYLNDLRTQGAEEHRKTYSFFYRISTSLLMELSNAFLVAPTSGLSRHLVVTSWRTQTLLLGFSPLTWSSGSFKVYDLSGRDIDARWAYPAPPTNDPREKGYVSLVPIGND
ncbi:MAG: hypothetical protein ACTSYL_01405 [Candidatus Thorarchaeota archaeon]